ncbi:oleate hydratase [Candidatus Falkowbacteria bacterium CG11_big_fil_rev_8_21_14_0_20_39_10]|uniref:Oleate hydratase n=1 Tax=Candidatus Falkowbacteria bacterium CG11_big_fil_rev_8_21_14_0_20_39_10 TaxID=1974570 RepID=A0A2M6K8D1_9BACT|nr:MAG: oleate hydratase [Candidatus Falkowbacteria bacterium CG11_big_fil_rev_8_21_14_0_20_39_10]
MNNKTSKIYLVGGGIASLAAAAYLIKDGRVRGKNITILAEAEKIGGALDAQYSNPLGGYVMRGIRMFEEKAFACAFDLMSLIPSLASPGKTIREEFVDFNKKNKTHSKSRLLKSAKAINLKPLKLNSKDRLKILNLILRSESSLQNLAIKDYFSASFFKSNFWYEFCTVFAFQPWHSLMEFRRYFIRFIQSFPNIDTLETIEIAPYNQYESVILPMINWLKKQGVNFATNTKVTNLGFDLNQGKKTVNRIYFSQDKKPGEIIVAKNDYVLATLGSIVANSSIGSMTKAPVLNLKNKSAAWTLWENIAKNNPEFGKPKVFNSHIDKSNWTSFTVTFREPTFFNLIQKFINKKVNGFGGVSLIDSNWFLSIVLSYRPYFLNQPKKVTLCWGFGLFPNKKGNYIKKKMSNCSGEEILTELIHHLGFKKYLDKIIKSSVCIPCLTPYVTSQFLPRAAGDRPSVIPKNSTNFAFLGQYCEIPDDVVFTMEYSIRSAQIAVYSLLGLKKKVTPIYRGTHHLKVLYQALKTALR